MEQYPVPQFLEQEGKIAFFITFRQFFYLVGAGIICFFIYHLLPRSFFYLLAPLIFLAAAALAFVTINGVPLLNLILGSFSFTLKSKNYVWKKKESPYPFKPVIRARIERPPTQTPLQTQRSQLRKTQTKVELRIK